MINKTIISGNAKLAYLKALVVVYVEKINKDPSLSDDQKVDKGILFAMTNIDLYNICAELQQEVPHKLCEYFYEANMCIEIEHSKKLVVKEPALIDWLIDW